MSKMPLLELLFHLSNTTTTYYLLFENYTGYLFINALLTKLLPLLSKLYISISHPTFMNCSLPIIPHVPFSHLISIYYWPFSPVCSRSTIFLLRCSYHLEFFTYCSPVYFFLCSVSF